MKFLFFHGVTRRAEADFDPAERMFPIAERAFPTLGGPALATQRWFEVSRGLLAKSDDENAQAGVRKYDTFGRLREVEDARAPKRMLAYATNGEGFLEVSDTLEFVTDAGGLLMYEWNHTTSQLDAFERPIRVTSDGWRQKKVERTASYDRLGRLTHESLPFFATEIPEYLVRTYDKLGRVTMLRNTGSGDTETVVYEGLVQRYTDARGMLTKLTRDVKGRLVRSANFENGTREVPTTYEYTAFDSLWKVTDPLGRLRVTSYDVLGRRESLVDPDSGATQSHYNAFDDEKWSQDPRGATLTTTFDGVGRKTGATLVPAGGVAAGLASNTESFVWDTAPSGKGKLASTTSMDGVVTSYGYTSLAQPASETWTIPGAGAYTLTTSYDLSGRVAGHGYPGGFATAFEYDVSGHVANVYWPGAQQPRIFHVEDVNAAGQVTSEEFGNQAITGRVYDKAFRLTYQDTMQRAQIGGSASFFQQLKYEYGPGGVVVAKHDTTKQLSEFFQHDFANRLKQWRVQQRYGGTCRGGIIDYAYDDAGNLLGRTMQGSTGFNVVNGYGPQGQMSGGVNALTSSTEGTAPTTFFKYDAAGNQTGVYYHRAASGPTDPGDKRLSWTHFNLPRQVVDNISATGTTTFRYDAGHQRVVETRGSDVKVTLGQAFEERQSGATTTRTHSVYAEGRLVAQFTQSALYGQWNPNFTATYVHQDALGSPDAMTGGSPGRPRLVERGKYDPFGERRNPDDVFAPAPQVHTRNVGFTGHQPDDSFGLTNMKGRLYDQRTGRFVSADPLVSAPAFGQSFNRYSYVHNDPLHFSDPSGFFLTPTTGGGVAGGATMGLIWALGGVTSWATLGWGLVVSAAVSLLVGCFLGAFFPHQLGLTAPPSSLPMGGPGGSAGQSGGSNAPSGAPSGRNAGNADDTSGRHLGSDRGTGQAGNSSNSSLLGAGGGSSGSFRMDSLTYDVVPHAGKALRYAEEGLARLRGQHKIDVRYTFPEPADTEGHLRSVTREEQLSLNLSLQTRPIGVRADSNIRRDALGSTPKFSNLAILNAPLQRNRSARSIAGTLVHEWVHNALDTQIQVQARDPNGTYGYLTLPLLKVEYRHPLTGEWRQVRGNKQTIHEAAADYVEDIFNSLQLDVR